MAIFHLEMRTFGRSRDAPIVAKAAYRAGERLHDVRRDQTYDFTRRRGIAATFLLAPHGLEVDREVFWNMVEAAERRRDAILAREVVVAIPCELTATGRKNCVLSLARSLVETFDLVADIAIHEPNERGDSRNHHAHILIPTRSVTTTGELGSHKLRQFDEKSTSREIVHDIRAQWATICNSELAAENQTSRIDRRSNHNRGITDKPSKKLGVDATGLERRTRQKSDRRRRSETIDAGYDRDLIQTLIACGLAMDLVETPNIASPELDIIKRLRDQADRAIKAQICTSAVTLPQAVVPESDERLPINFLGAVQRGAETNERPTVQTRSMAPTGLSVTMRPFAARIAQIRSAEHRVPGSAEQDMSGTGGRALTSDTALLTAVSEPDSTLYVDASRDRERHVKSKETQVAMHAAAITMMRAGDQNVLGSEWLGWAADIIEAEVGIPKNVLLAAIARMAALVPINAIITSASQWAEVLRRYSDALNTRILTAQNRRQVYPSRSGDESYLWSDGGPSTENDFLVLDGVASAFDLIMENPSAAVRRSATEKPTPIIPDEIPIAYDGKPADIHVARTIIKAAESQAGPGDSIKHNAEPAAIFASQIPKMTAQVRDTTVPDAPPAESSKQRLHADDGRTAIPLSTSPHATGAGQAAALAVMALRLGAVAMLSGSYLRRVEDFAVLQRLAKLDAAAFMDQARDLLKTVAMSEVRNTRTFPNAVFREVDAIRHDELSQVAAHIKAGPQSSASSDKAIRRPQKKRENVPSK